MSILNFIKPEKVIMVKSTESQGDFEFRPLEPGYGLTIGNALRRVLLSSLEGYAITSIRINGVDHEFSVIDGVVEDVVQIILSLKQVRLKKQVEEFDLEEERLKLAAEEKEEMLRRMRSGGGKSDGIKKALAGLSSDFRTMIILRDIQELSYDEISKIMDIPLGTVKSRINRGRLKLQESLRKKGEQP